MAVGAAVPNSCPGWLWLSSRCSPSDIRTSVGWTVVTEDGSVAVHWEHTVAVLDDGPWVLTAFDGGRAELEERGVTLSALAD